MSAALMYEQLGLATTSTSSIQDLAPHQKRRKTQKKGPSSRQPVQKSKPLPSAENRDPNSYCNGYDDMTSRKLDASRDSHHDRKLSNQSTTRESRDVVFESSTEDGLKANELAEVDVLLSCADNVSCPVRIVPTKRNPKRKRTKASSHDGVSLKKKDKSVTLAETSKPTPPHKPPKRTTKSTKAVRVVDQCTEMLGKKKETVLDGKEEATRLFEWLIHPVNPNQFFKELWENKPLLIKRHNPNYNEGWFSCSDFSRILRDNPIQFGTHLDLTSYKDGKRETHNQPGRAHPHLVWKHYRAGGSIRMLNPQTYSEQVWLLLSTLQDYFRSTMGANVYLTAPGTQGFAPHWDDIEAFMIQLEGKKHWRLYSPRSDSETLPRHSSPNISQCDLGKPILDTVLEPGDMLYFPRGTIHQGNCLPDTHSLHITISTYQLNTWGDLLEKLVPKALSMALQEDKDYRVGLPRDYLDYTGVSRSDTDSGSRAVFLKKVEDLMTRLVRYAPVDSAVDDMASRLLHDSLPPHPSRGSVQTYASHSDCNAGSVTSTRVVITCTSRVRLTTPYCARVLVHEECVSLQHTSSNTRLIQEIEQQEIDYPADYGPTLEILTNSYPTFVTVRALPLPTKTGVELVQELADMGILQVHTKQASQHLFSTIKSKVRERKSAPHFIKEQKSRKSSDDEIPVKLRVKSSGDDRRLPRPYSGIWDPPTRDIAEKKAKSLERRGQKGSSLEKRFTYGRCSNATINSNSATLTEV